VDAFDVRDVADPYYGDHTTFDATLDQIEKAADVIVSRLAQSPTRR